MDVCGNKTINMKKLLVSILLSALIAVTAHAKDYNRVSFACRNGKVQILTVGSYEGLIVKENGARQHYEEGLWKAIRITDDSVYLQQTLMDRPNSLTGSLESAYDTTAISIDAIRALKIAKPDPELTGTVVGDIFLCLIFPPALPYHLTRQAWVNTFPTKRYRISRRTERIYE